MASTSALVHTTENATMDPLNGSSSNNVAGSNSDPWAEYPAPKAIVLGSFLLLGLLGNIFMVVTISHTKRLREIAFYVLLLNHAVVNMCECLLNMSLILSSTVISSWNYGGILCNVSSSLVQIVCIEGVLSLTILATDRAIAIRFRDRYESILSKPRVGILVAFTWLQSAAFSIPIIVGVVPSNAVDNIYYCTVSSGSSVIFLSFAAFFCFLIPVILMCVFYIYIIRTSFKERFVVRALLAQTNYNDDSSEEPKIHREFRYSKLTGTLFLVWGCLVGPHVITSYFSQFQLSNEIDSIRDEDLMYVWHVDLVLLWLRFSFVLALPVCVCLWDKNLVRLFRDIMFCRKNNCSPRTSAKNKQADLDKALQEEEKMKEAFTPNNVFQVPVLFATSQGVHIQTFTEKHPETLVFDNYGGIRGRKCDVVGSTDNLNHVEDDTSDYDSGNEMDPFSVSHPVSVKQLQQRQQLALRERSSSQPEVRDRQTSETIGTEVSAGDSGLDLTTSNVLFTKTNSIPIDEEKNKHDTITLQKSDSDSGVICHGADSGNCDDQKPCAEEDQGSPNVDTDRKWLETKNTQNAFSTKPCILDIYENERRVAINQDNLTSETKTGSENDLFKTTLIEQERIGVNASPVTKRKKKKKKDAREKTEVSMETPQSPVPPRPPARLAPILSSPSIKNPYSGLDARPGSRTSFSSQCSVLDSPNLEGSRIRRSSSDINSGMAIAAKVASKSNFLTDLAPAKKRSKRKGKEYRTLCDEEMTLVSESSNGGVEASTTVTPAHGRQTSTVGLENMSRSSLTLDCSRPVKQVQDEVVTPSECLFGTGPSGPPFGVKEGRDLNGVTNYGYTDDSDVATGSQAIPTILTAMQYRTDNCAIGAESTTAAADESKLI